MIAGIDFGSKKAGTTVIAWVDGDVIQIAQSEKNKDADQFILDWTAAQQPDAIYLDAPLSLPGVYQKLDEYSDYFYRHGDRVLRAMSPLFLGGLTARAMQLKAKLEASETVVYEVYPGALAKEFQFDRKQYKKEKIHLPVLTQELLGHYPQLQLTTPFQNWHQFDALLALFSGFRHQNNQHISYGKAEEGVIIV